MAKAAAAKKPKKARDKKEEKKVRDEQDIDIVGQEYRKILAKAEKAKATSVCEFWQEGFQNRHSKVDAALKRLNEELKGVKPESFDSVKDVANIKKFADQLRVAVAEKDAYSIDVKFAANDLFKFCHDNVIFKQTAAIDKTASFHNKLGILEFKKN